MDKVVRITSFKDKGNDLQYWLSKSPEDRIAAIEILRQQYFILTGNVQQGFSPVCIVINRSKS
jgi:hypothetical protein